MKSGRQCTLVHGGPRRRSRPGSEATERTQLQAGSPNVLLRTCALAVILGSYCNWRAVEKKWMMGTLSFCCLFWWERDLKSQEPPNHPLCPGASRGASWDAMARPRFVKQLGQTVSEGLERLHPRGRQASVFPAITPTLAGCFTKFLINEDPSFPCYLCSWLHTSPLWSRRV